MCDPTSRGTRTGARRERPPPRPRRLLVCTITGAALVLASCATGVPDVGPADIPRLSAEVTERPDDLELRVRLGIAQYRADAHDAALASLRIAVEDGHATGPALLYLGLTHEAREEWGEALDAYGRYLDQDPSGAIRGDVEARVRLMGRNLLTARAREALALEDRVADARAVTPRSVAVLPFAFNSTRAELEPLIYALADMMSTDFALSNALVVLERAQVQALLDEMALTEAGYAEPGTGARAGRLLRAEHVVQGVLTTLGGDRLQTDAEVMSVASSAGIGGLSESAALDDLFDMEKALVIGTIRDVLGMELTPAEEQAILDNRMDNVLAFLTYGEGLREMDRGDFRAARERFEAARALEGSGNPMLESALEASEELTTASETEAGTLAARAGESGALGGGMMGPPARTTTGAEAAASRGRLTGLTDGIAPTPASGLLDIRSGDLGATRTNDSGGTEREPIVEATGEVGLTGSGATIRLVIPRPGGDR